MVNHRSNWAIFNSYVKLPEGNNTRLTEKPEGSGS